MRFLFVLVFVLAVTGCKTAKNVNSNSVSQEDQLVISMKKTACYGTCPVYELQIYSDLSVTLKGEQYIDKIGNHKASISQERLDELITKFREAEFFSFEDRYWDTVSDLPTTYVYFSDKGQEKKVMDYYNAPQSLKDLEKEVSMLLDELEWTKVEE